MNKTEKLISEIIKIGFPLPKYNYDYKKFVSTVPENISLDDRVIGVENADLHDSFEDACLRIINWYKENML